MLGAIVGDVIGSVYEGSRSWQREKTPHFEPLFHPQARFTDDTVLTVAVADALRHHYGCDVSCRGTVPPALRAFLEATDFEGAVRLAVSLGGDADTLACIAGAVAGAFYGVPAAVRGQTLAHLDDRLRGVVAAFEARFPGR